ncbi:MAG: hypothetical protein HKN00_08795 [Flavobacteriaceae bacterium]|nr:hypothetical protein [Bacteroidia bacterium]NNF75266.1 hypothetical protein [Flavobacteriaceae bacterium]NNK72503.1 hypothetical protein [Flavobacteriaceae bacterium]
MKLRILIILLLFYGLACKHENGETPVSTNTETLTQMEFDKEKWRVKDGKDYPYRDQMLNAVIYNDSIRDLNRAEIIELLGEPSYYRDDKNFLYYRINETNIGFWTLHTKTMVIKLTDKNIVEWIKIHE